MRKTNTVYKTHKSRKKWLYIAGGLVLAAIIFTVLELTNVINVFHGPPPPPTGAVTKGEVSTPVSSPASKSAKSSSNTSAPTSSSKNAAAPAAATIAPSGIFVSNHRPNLSGHPAPNNIASSCLTNPGISCQITFTMGGTTKFLAAKTTDAEGAAYWDWTLQSVGLTEGTWTIQATASNGADVKSSTDAQVLVVAQ